MKFKTLDDKTYSIAIRNFGKDRQRSNYHSEALKLCRETYPLDNPVEELPIKIYFNQTLYIDIFLPTIRLAVEVQGEQHYEYNSFYHNDIGQLYVQRRLDTLKREWCLLNEIELIELKYNERKHWRERITGAR